MSQHRHLVRTFSFWLALAFPLGSAFILSALIFNSVEVNGFCFTPDCISNFLELYKLPIAIAGLSLPLVAMIASLHRSREAALQIDLGQQQFGEALKNNIFGNYLKHRDGFFTLLDRYSKEESMEKLAIKIDQSGLYVALFPKNSFSTLNFKGSGAHWEKLESSINNLYSSYSQLGTGAEVDPVLFFQQYSDCVAGLYFGLEEGDWYSVNSQDDLYIILPNIKPGVGLLAMVRRVFSLYDAILIYMGNDGLDYAHLFSDEVRNKTIEVSRILNRVTR